MSTVSSPSLHVHCLPCGEVIDLLTQLPFRCPGARAGDNVDHILSLGQRATPGDWPVSVDQNPFQRFSNFSVARALADRVGVSRAEYAGLVSELDAAVKTVDGAGFVTTPYVDGEELGVWIKDETNAVGGSHKARHLMGIALYMAVAERVPALASQLADAPLAIASCGNAALAAATIAAAMKRPLDVYIPDWAADSIVSRLGELGARLHICERDSDTPPGDPCYHAFVAAVEAGAVPFTCQGTQNGLAIDGGRTIGFELAEQYMGCGSPHLKRLFIQVGGGALASSILQGLWMAQTSQVIPELPHLHIVQVESAQPLVRAWRKLARELVGLDLPDHQLASRIREELNPDAVHDAWVAASRKRSDYMWPMETEPKSIASGILDDETYDGFASIFGMLKTGGFPVVVDEETVARAHRDAHAATTINVCATGSAGYAGVLALRAQGLIDSKDETAVLFTGVER
ncbi:MAG: threonine synthase [Planctomycetota bacterium]